MTSKRNLSYFLEKYGKEYTDKEIIQAYIEVNGLVGDYKVMIDRLTESYYPDDYQHLINKESLLKDIKEHTEDKVYTEEAVDAVDDVIRIVEEAEEWG